MEKKDFEDIEVNKKPFHASKQAVYSNLVDINKIKTSDKFKYSSNDFKYLIGYKDDDIVRPLCINFPQMSGYIKYLENGGENLSFMIEDDSVLVKYNEISNKIKATFNKSFIACLFMMETFQKLKQKNLMV